ncbi:hypothetical protein Tco_0175237 [Tanacetum coccineum]
MKSNCSNWGSDTSGRGVSIRGEGQLKRILDVTQNLVLMVEEKHYKSAVEGSIPVFVKFVSRMDTAEEIDDLFVGDAEFWWVCLFVAVLENEPDAEQKQIPNKGYEKSYMHRDVLYNHVIMIDYSPLLFPNITHVFYDQTSAMDIVCYKAVYERFHVRFESLLNKDLRSELIDEEPKIVDAEDLD